MCHTTPIIRVPEKWWQLKCIEEDCEIPLFSSTETLKLSGFSHPIKLWFEFTKSKFISTIYNDIWLQSRETTLLGGRLSRMGPLDLPQLDSTSLMSILTGGEPQCAMLSMDPWHPECTVFWIVSTRLESWTCNSMCAFLLGSSHEPIW